ncbi:hypothetical protein TNCV_2868941 [Trichonephila clavipes]|nr:hypothetical protein TNCV_2868941 [Trichonephila clavipes]
MKPCPDHSPNHLASRIARGTETILIRTEDMTVDEMSSFCALYTTLSDVVDWQLSKGCSGRTGHLCESVGPH